MAQSRQPRPQPAAPDGMSQRTTTMEVVDIWYDDGTVDRVNPNRPRLLFNFAAAHEGKEAPETPQENMWMLWHALGRPGESVEAWYETIIHMERKPVELVGKARS